MLDCGRFPVKRTLGRRVDVWATIFRDGHDDPPRGGPVPPARRARVAARRRWSRIGQRPLARRLRADRARPLAVLDRGLGRPRRLVAVRARAQGRRRARTIWRASSSEGAALLGVPSLTVEQGAGRPDRRSRTRGRHAAPPLELIVDRERARFGAWYELFPRSWGGFAGVERVLPELAELGFDVVYLPPIHPIGRTHRKGKNNALVAAPGRSGQPVGDRLRGRRPHGGRPRARHARRTSTGSSRAAPSSASRSRSTSRSSARPTTRGSRSIPSGSTAAPTARSSTPRTRPSATRTSTTSTSTARTGAALWKALRDVVLFWVGHGVRIFRVDNPHTKPVAFWEWLIREVQDRHPDVVFLSEAFTRPATMATLAKAGFSQSYTYFTWRNTKGELTEYVRQLTSGDCRSSSGRTSSPTRRTSCTSTCSTAAGPRSRRGSCSPRRCRRATASTPASSAARTSRCEAGSEEYLDSEKYELKERALDGPLLPLVARLNEARRANPALQRLDNLDLPRDGQRVADRLRQAGAGQHGARRASTSTRRRRARGSSRCRTFSASGRRSRSPTC